MMLVCSGSCHLQQWRTRLGGRGRALALQAARPGLCSSRNQRRGLLPLAAQPSGSPAPDSGESGVSLDLEEESGPVETVSEWLARHAQDPAELERQAPVWEALDRLLGGRQVAVQVVRSEPRLLDMPVWLIAGNVGVMRGLGLAPSEVARSIYKCPALFRRDFTSAAMQDKFSYFQQALGKPLRFVLARQPHMLTRDLGEIKRKVSFMQAKGDMQYQRTLAWVALSDSAFCWHFGYDLREFQAWQPKEEQEGGQEEGSAV